MKTSFRILSLLFLLLFSMSCSLRKATSAEVSDVSSWVRRGLGVHYCNCFA